MSRKMVNGVVLSLTENDLSQKRADDAGVNDRMCASVRNQRTRLLTDTDWQALSDNTMTPAWASYRQALRDITDQDGFPSDVVWPTKP